MKNKSTHRWRPLGAIISGLLVTAATVVLADSSSATGADAATGATTSFVSHEAESSVLGNGATAASLGSAPTSQYSSPALEASGHAYVHLDGTGESVKWTNTTGKQITAVNLRVSVPDSTSGGGAATTLNLYVDGAFRQALNLNSRQSYLYEGGDGQYNGNAQNPAGGAPRVFFDESHALISGAPIAPGSTVMLRKDSSNSAAYYDIDVIDTENVPAPLPQPADSVAITSCGAVADNTSTNGTANSGVADSTAAIQKCINQAKSQSKSLYIPAGTFYLRGTQGLQANGITITGAGPWYSTVYRDVPLPNSVPLGAIFSLTSTTVKNLHLDSNATSRAMVDGAGGAMDTTGTNWVADNVWVEHTLSGIWGSGVGGTVKSSRMNSIWADGINLNNVSLNNTVGNNLSATNNFIRGSGDDAIAINSVDWNQFGDEKTYYTPMSGVTISHNTSIAPWGGKGVSVYGGSGHVVEDNYISDTARYIGLGIGKFGANGSNLRSSVVSGNVIARSGGNAYNQSQPALHIGNGGDGHSTGTVDGVTVTGNTITNSLYDSVGFSTGTNTLFRNNTITLPGRDGIVVSPPFYPAPTGSATVSSNTVTGVSSGHTPYINNSAGFTAQGTGNTFTIPASTPFTVAAAIPGTVQVENYDKGGPGVAYFVNTTNGSATGYRPDMVDLEATSDTGGGYNLAWTSSNQWFRYSVNAAAARSFKVSFRVASPTAVSNAFHLADSQGNNLTGGINIPATGGYQSWTTVTATLSLPAGPQVLTLFQDSGNWNLNYMTFHG